MKHIFILIKDDLYLKYYLNNLTIGSICPKLIFFRQTLTNSWEKSFVTTTSLLIDFIAEKEFEDICFDFGIEVEIGTNEDMNM
jgi:hypothetical protein